MRTDRRGVAGLNILASVIALLFMIGFIIMIFALIGGELEEETLTSTTNTTVDNVTTQTLVNDTGAYLTIGSVSSATLRSCVLSVDEIVTNWTGDEVEETVQANNYTVDTNCKIKFSSTTPDTFINNTYWNVTGNITYDTDTTASKAINDTADELSDSTSWFSIIIILAVMVVLILLTVIIISTIRGSGLLGVGETRTRGSPVKGETA